MRIPEPARALLDHRLLQLSLLTLLLGTAGAIAFHLKFSVLDPDIWWHMKVGDWMFEHAAIPHTGILSRTAAERPWVAYSWGYEVLLSRAYAWFGLLGIGVFGTLLTLGVAYAVYWMLRRLSYQFWPAIVLGVIACSAFLFNGMPRPFFFSIMLYCVTLTLLLEANRTGQVRMLYPLPLVFMLWANLHIQFVYGLAVVGLFAAVSVAQSAARKLGVKPEFFSEPLLPATSVVGISAVCVLATLLGPNFYHPYVAVLEYSKAKFSYSVIIELQPLSFRGFSHYAELLLAGAAFFAVGWKRKLDPFKLLLLIAATVIAFRTMRDAWFLCTSAAASIADCLGNPNEAESRETWLENVGVAAALVIVLLLAARATDFNERALDRAISGQYPVNAINFLRQNPAPGPIYNNLNWGGFLMWYMPDYPVAIDGRNDLYGDDLDRLFYASQSAQAGYTTDPYLNEAAVVLLDSELPLAKILSIDPRFELVYRDQIATVYTRRQ